VGSPLPSVKGSYRTRCTLGGLERHVRHDASKQVAECRRLQPWIAFPLDIGRLGPTSTCGGPERWQIATTLSCLTGTDITDCWAKGYSRALQVAVKPQKRLSLPGARFGTAHER
jgi:hypothetical protein